MLTKPIKPSIILLLLVLYFLPRVLHAQGGTAERLGLKYTYYKSATNWHRDGTSQGWTDRELLVANNRGVASYQLIKLPFNPKKMRYENIKVEVVNDTGFFVVDPKNYEIKSEQIKNDSYDALSIIVIPVSNLKPGSRLRIYTEFNQFAADYPEHLEVATKLNPGYDSDLVSYTFTFPSDWRFEFHDDANKYRPFTTIATQDRAVTTIVSVNKSNVLGPSQPENDQSDPIAHESILYISSHKDMIEASKTVFAEYAPVLNQNLPEKLLQSFGPKPKLPLNKENALQMLITGIKQVFYDFHYFGDYREALSGHKPRDLALVVDTAYGDCKDFAILLYHYARHLGLSADIVLTFSSDRPVYYPQIPMIIANHAIVRVKIPGENNYWYVDSTTDVPYVDISHKNLAGKTAFVIGPSAPEQVMIPEYQPEDSTWDITEEIELNKFPLKTVDVSFKYEGFGGLQTQEAILEKSFSKRKDYFRDEYDEDIVRLSVDRLSISENPLSPYTVKVDMRLIIEDQLMQSGLFKIIDTGYQTGGTYKKIIATAISTRKTDLFLGYPRSGTLVVKFKPGTYKKLLGIPKSCKIISSWFEFDRKIQSKPFVQTDHYRVLKRVISVDEIKSQDFKKLRDELDDCLNGVRVIYE